MKEDYYARYWEERDKNNELTKEIKELKEEIEFQKAIVKGLVEGIRGKK